LIGTDNTARKQVEAEQKQLDQRLRDQQFYTRSLIESNIDALMTTDPAGIITDVNKQMEALTGCTRDELIGAPFKNYFTDPERAEAGIKRVLSGSKVTDYELTARAGTARKPWCPTTRPPSTTATGSCRACSPRRATSRSANASSRRCRKRTSSWREPRPRRKRPTSRNRISFPA
jgi:PAS domain-containing protein